MLEQVDTGIYNVSVKGVWLAGKLSWPISNRNWQLTAERLVGREVKLAYLEEELATDS